MEYEIKIQNTPNPNALKFIMNVPVIASGNATFKSASERESTPLAARLFDLTGVTEVFFFDNYITVTQDGSADWHTLEGQIKKTISQNFDNHDPDITLDNKPSVATPKTDNEDINKINEILDRTVRPYLQMDGGDLQVLALENNALKISYQGACGSCPSATRGTMLAVENILRNEFNPEITVQIG